MTDQKPKRGLSRRAFLRLGGCAGIVAVSGAVGGVVLDRETDFFDRLRGVTHTPLLKNKDAWDYTGGTLTLTLDQIPELAEPGSAVRLEDGAVPKDLLIVHGVDGNFYVYFNECTHGQRKIDLDDDGRLRCTSVSSSVFNYDGSVKSGPAEDDLTTYAVALEGDTLMVTLA